MVTFYKDDIFEMNQYIYNDQENYFNLILKERQKERDPNRFFLKYISQDILSNYDFNDKKSLNEFRELSFTSQSPLILMGGCNMDLDYLKDGFRYSGIQMSDPKKVIKGTFYTYEGKMIYSPLLGFFSEQRDLIKFANDNYFTTLTFKEIMLGQLRDIKEYFIHTGYYHDSKDILKNGQYTMDKISKKEMLEFITDPNEGEKVYRKYINRKHL